MAALRRLRRRRGSGRTLADVVYLVYAVALLTALLGAIVVHAITVTVFTPDAVDALHAPSFPTRLGLTADLLLAAAAPVGLARGPALRRPFAAWAVVGSDVPSRTSLRAPLLGSMAVLAALCATAAAVAAAAASPGAGGSGALAVLGLVDAGIPGRVPGVGGVGAVVVVAAGAVAVGIAVTVLWLLGQVLGRRAAWGSAAVLVAAAAVSVASPSVPVSPGSWLANLWRAVVAPWTYAFGDAGFGWVAGADPLAVAAPAAALAALAVAALVACALLSARVDPHRVLATALRWDVAGTLGASGDVSGAFGAFRALPTAGRRLRAAPARRLATVRRDLVAALRTPGRFAAGTLGAAVGGAVLALALAGSWPLAAPGGLLVFVSAGVWCDGLRHAADAVGRPALYGHAPAGSTLRHSALPAACTAVAAVLGAFLAAWWWASPWWVVPAVAAFAVYGVVVRVYDAARPPLPVALLLPVPTPAGDASVLLVAVWQADALLYAGAAPLLVCLAPGAWPALALLAPAALVGALAAARLRRLR